MTERDWMYTVLLDSPDTPARKVQIAALGDYDDPRYGSFSITKDDVEDWKKNLSALPGGQALIDFEHRSERKPRDSQAAGWIDGIELADGGRVLASVRWTPKGEKAIKSRRYQFISPAYGKFENERGETFKNALVSAGLTNKPALSGLPAITLAAPERLEAAGNALALLDVSQAERDQAVKEGFALPDGSYPIRTSPSFTAPRSWPARVTAT